MKKYRLYIFDLDLTTVDSIESSIICYEAAFKACGLKFDRSTTSRCLSLNLTELYNEIEKEAPNCGMKFFNAFVEASAIAFAKYGKFYPEVDKVFEIINNNNGLVALFTNRNAHDIQAILDANPEVKKNVHYFVGSDMVKQMKPNPEGIIMCLDKFGIAKEDTLYIGDSICDEQAATAAGCDFYYVDRFKKREIKVVAHDTLEDLIK